MTAIHATAHARGGVAIWRSNDGTLLTTLAVEDARTLADQIVGATFDQPEPFEVVGETVYDENGPANPADPFGFARAVQVDHLTGDELDKVADILKGI